MPGIQPVYGAVFGSRNRTNGGDSREKAGRGSPGETLPRSARRGRRALLQRETFKASGSWFATSFPVSFIARFFDEYCPQIPGLHRCIAHPAERELATNSQ